MFRQLLASKYCDYNKLLQISDADEIAYTIKYMMTTLVPGKTDSFSSDSIKISVARVKHSSREGNSEIN